jgi:hypothetical protein
MSGLGSSTQQWTREIVRRKAARLKAGLEGPTLAPYS